VPKAFVIDPTPALPPVADIIISVSLFLVKVIFAPSVKLTSESVPVAAFSFKGTDEPVFSKALKLYVSPS